MVSRGVHSKFLELSKPPGPAGWWHSLGSVIRAVGRVVDTVGHTVQGPSGFQEKLPIPCTVVAAAGKKPTFDKSFVAPSATLAGDVRLDPGVSVWYGSTLTARKAHIALGPMSNVQESATLVAAAAGVSVGRAASVGPGAYVEDAAIGEGCSVGAGCRILAGASIGKGASLAAGSLVPAGVKVPPGEHWAGVPAKKVAALSPAEMDEAVKDARDTLAVAAVHAEHAWMPLADIEFQTYQYKMERLRPDDWTQSLRDTPTFEPLPKLRDKIDDARKQIDM
mmetsp:Transcript_24888/g.83436  ORF Transcript_24888/g.83436 Transcript_24888/m.83436 type:complete len:279 (-) Transcript_24888:473-1309(-)